MQENRTDRFARIAGLIFVGLLLIGPLVFLQHNLLLLAGKDETHLDILAREKLMNEMEGFQDALRPDNYIEQALNELNQHFSLKPPPGQENELSLIPGVDPKLIDAGFIDKALAFLKSRFAIQPFLMLTTDCDMQNHWLWTASQLFPDRDTFDRFAESAIYGLSCVDDDPVNYLPYSESLPDRIAAFTERNRKIDGNPHQVFASYFVRHISAFTNPMLYQGQARVFFSNRLGNQRAYQIFHQLKRGHPPLESLLGLYYCCFNNCDLPPATILKRAMPAKNPDARRNLLKMTIRQPFFKVASGRLFYFSGFPTIFRTLVEDYGIKNPATSKQIMQFIASHCLVTSIDSAMLVSDFRKPAAMVGGLIKLMLLLLLAAIVRFMPGSANLPLKLGGKLRLAVALSVLLPVTGFLAIILLTRSNSERLAIHSCQTRIRQQLQFFEKLVNENDPRLLMMFQGFKKHFADSLHAAGPVAQPQIAMTDPYRLLEFANISLFFDQNARMLKFYEQRKYEGHIKEMGGLFRILSELGTANRNNMLIQDMQRRHLFVSSFTDSYWDVFATGPVLAKESLFTKNFLSMSALKRACNQLIANPESPNTPEAVLFNEVDDTSIMRSLLKQIWKEAPALLTDYSEDHLIDFSLFLRGPSELRELQIPRKGRGTGQLRAIAQKAIQRRTSGSLVNRLDDRIELQNWLYYEDTPVIIAARAVIPAVPIHPPIYFILPMALFAYAVLAMALLSDSLAEALLVPVQTLLAFVGSIQNDQLNVKAEIKSGDEFTELADSFNRMSTGLCQRAKMRRFVSEKLFESLDNSQAETTGLATVTILSSDIRGFTSISEQYPPEEIVSLLNEYLSLMEDAITSHGGSIEKIIGDAIIAAFYHNDTGDNHAVRACMAALAMRQRLDEFNRNRQQQQCFTLETGIGLATGPAVLGFAGTTTRRREFFLIGDVLQRAETLESLTRTGTVSKVFADCETCDLAAEKLEFCAATDPNAIWRELKNAA